MNTKVTKYFDAQELYDDITLQAKIQGQAASDSISKEQQAINLLGLLFPNADADRLVQSINLNIATLKEIALQYKKEIEGDSQVYKDVFLVAMGEIAVQLYEYEQVVHILYPHIAPLCVTMALWYKNYLVNNTVHARA